MHSLRIRKHAVCLVKSSFASTAQGNARAYGLCKMRREAHAVINLESNKMYRASRNFASKISPFLALVCSGTQVHGRGNFCKEIIILVLVCSVRFRAMSIGVPFNNTKMHVTSYVSA